MFYVWQSAKNPPSQDHSKPCPFPFQCTPIQVCRHVTALKVLFCSPQMDPHWDEPFVFRWGEKRSDGTNGGRKTGQDILETKTLVCGTWGQAAAMPAMPASAFCGGIPEGIQCIKGWNAGILGPSIISMRAVQLPGILKSHYHILSTPLCPSISCNFFNNVIQKRAVNGRGVMLQSGAHQDTNFL